jgi:hypothetical protein
MRPTFAVATSIVASLTLAPMVAAQATYTTGFEEPDFSLGDVAGQDGWNHINNSPTRGTIVTLPPDSPAGLGSQALELSTRETDFFGVTNHLFSATIDPPAGETGSTLEDAVVPDPQSLFRASFWYRMPSTAVASTHPAGRFAELNPSSKRVADDAPAHRYAQVRLFHDAGDGLVRVELGWYPDYPPDPPRPFSTAVIASGLAWGEWYRFEYSIRFLDGPPSGPPNDLFTVRIFDRDGLEISSVEASSCASTWESGWKSGGFDDRTTARAVNGFDFASTTGPDGTVIGHLDGLTITASEAPAPTLEIISGDGQTGLVGALLGEPLLVRVVDEQAHQEQCYPVSFAIESGPPTAVGQSLGSPFVTIGRDGRAASTFRFGGAPGTYTISATAPGIESPVLFTVTALLGVVTAAIPTVGTWGMALLALALAAAAVGVLRR